MNNNNENSTSRRNTRRGGRRNGRPAVAAVSPVPTVDHAARAARLAADREHMALRLSRLTSHAERAEQMFDTVPGYRELLNGEHAATMKVFYEQLEWLAGFDPAVASTRQLRDAREAANSMYELVLVPALGLKTKRAA